MARAVERRADMPRLAHAITVARFDRPSAVPPRGGMWDGVEHAATAYLRARRTGHDTRWARHALARAIALAVLSGEIHGALGVVTGAMKQHILRDGGSINIGRLVQYGGTPRAGEMVEMIGMMRHRVMPRHAWGAVRPIAEAMTASLLSAVVSVLASAAAVISDIVYAVLQGAASAPTMRSDRDPPRPPPALAGVMTTAPPLAPPTAA